MKRWKLSPDKGPVLTPSRQKICSKVCLTVVVPAAEEPVTAMIGWRADMAGYDFGRVKRCGGADKTQRPRRETRSAFAPPWRLRAAAVGGVSSWCVITGDALDFVLFEPRMTDALNALPGCRSRIRWRPVVAAPPACLDDEAHRVGLGTSGAACRPCRRFSRPSGT